MAALAQKGREKQMMLLWLKCQLQINEAILTHKLLSRKKIRNGAAAHVKTNQSRKSLHEVKLFACPIPHLLSKYI